MKKPTVVFVLTFLLMGCATYPPPKIENGYYQNYRYGFALDLPGSDWVLMEKPPPELTAAIPGEMRKNLTLSLFNKETIGAIIVLTDKNQLSPHEIVTQIAALRAGFLVGVEMKGARNCHVSWTYPHNRDACVEFDHEDAISKSKGNMFMRIFPVGNNVNMIMIVFVSNHITYEQNFPAFVEVVKSLRHGNEYTVSELTEDETTIIKEDLAKILKEHKTWWETDEKRGKRADLGSANLCGSNLRGANLRKANLSSADLSLADLSEAKLNGADLRGAILRGAKLHGADLSWAKLSGANLSWANLSEAKLDGADLSGADLSGAKRSGAK